MENQADRLVRSGPSCPRCEEMELLLRTLRRVWKGEQVAVESVDSKRSLKGRFFVAVVVLVQVAWGAAVVFLLVHFL